MQLERFISEHLVASRFMDSGFVTVHLCLLFFRLLDMQCSFMCIPISLHTGVASAALCSGRIKQQSSALDKTKYQTQLLC